MINRCRGTTGDSVALQREEEWRRRHDRKRFKKACQMRQLYRATLRYSKLFGIGWARRRPSRSAIGGTRLESFDDRRDSLPEADAHRLQSVALACPLELVEQRGHQLGARAAEGMAERDRAAVDVDPAHVRVILALPRQYHGRERLVDLDQIDLVERHTGLAEHALGRRDRAREHDDRIDAREGGRDDAGP